MPGGHTSHIEPWGATLVRRIPGLAGRAAMAARLHWGRVEPAAGPGRLRWTAEPVTRPSGTAAAGGVMRIADLLHPAAAGRPRFFSLAAGGLTLAVSLGAVPAAATAPAAGAPAAAAAAAGRATVTNLTGTPAAVST